MPGKLRGARHNSRNSAVQSNQPSWTGQYKKGVQYDFKFTPVNTMYKVKLHNYKTVKGTDYSSQVKMFKWL